VTVALGRHDDRSETPWRSDLESPPCVVAVRRQRAVLPAGADEVARIERGSVVEEPT